MVNSQTPVYLPGFPKTLDSVYRPIFYGSTPVVTDIDRDGRNEVLFALYKPEHTKIYVLKSDGSDLSGWPVTVFPAYSWPAIAAGDVNNDGYIDVVMRNNDSLYVFDYLGKSLPGFPLFYSDDNLAQVTLYDINSNGFLEIIIKGKNSIAVLDHNGNMISGWPRQLPGYSNRVLSPPVSVADLDDDGFAEIIVNSSCSDISLCDSSFISVFRYDGSQFPGWPLKMDSNYVYYSQPATIFKDRDSDSTFLYVNSAHYYPNSDSSLTKTSKYTASGNLVSSHYTVSFVESSSIAILKKNNLKYKAFGSEPIPVYLLKGMEQLANNYPVWGNGYYFNSPLLLEMNSNIFTVTIRKGIDPITLSSYVYFYDEFGLQPSWSPLRPLGVLGSAGIFGDLNNDNQLDFVILSTLDTNLLARPKIHVWTFPGVTFDHNNLHWPMYAHDRYRTNQHGFIPPDEPVGIQPYSSIVPESSSLFQNYPNPFNPATTIKFDIKNSSEVTLIIFDALGRKIRTLVNERLKSGSFSIVFDGSGLSSGVYFYRLMTEGFAESRKMLIIR